MGIYRLYVILAAGVVWTVAVIALIIINGAWCGTASKRGKQ